MLGVEPTMRPELYHKTNLTSETEEFLKFVLSKACPVICNMAVGSQLGQFKSVEYILL